MQKNFAWCSLLATDQYLGGIIGLNYSLQKVKTKYPFFVMVTENLTQNTLSILDQENIPYKKIKLNNYKKKSDSHNYQVTLNKFYFLGYEEYNKICFIDADVVFLKNIDKIFNSFVGRALYCGKYTDMNEVRFDTDNSMIKKYNGMIMLAKPKRKKMNYIFEQHKYNSDDEDTLMKIKFPVKTFNKDIYEKIMHYATPNLEKYWYIYNNNISRIQNHIERIMEKNNESQQSRNYFR